MLSPDCTQVTVCSLDSIGGRTLFLLCDSGWIVAFKLLDVNKAVAGIAFIIAALWTLFAVLLFLVIMRVCYFTT